MSGPAPHRASGSEAGYSMVAVIAAMAVTAILMTAAIPAWKYVIKDAREEELLFRGGQIAEAVERYQKKNGNTLPTSVEVLVKGRYLRKAYKDPMTKDGKWRFLRQGEGAGMPLPGQGGVPGAPGQPGGPAGGGAFPSGPDGGPGGGGLGGPGGGLGGPGNSGPGLPGGGLGNTTGPMGGFTGVASMSTDKSLRVMNGRTKYSEWLFVAGQPRVVGSQPVRQNPMNPQGGPMPPGQPGSPGGQPGGGPIQPGPGNLPNPPGR